MRQTQRHPDRQKPGGRNLGAGGAEREAGRGRRPKAKRLHPESCTWPSTGAAEMVVGSGGSRHTQAQGTQDRSSSLESWFSGVLPTPSLLLSLVSGHCFLSPATHTHTPHSLSPSLCLCLSFRLYQPLPLVLPLSLLHLCLRSLCHPWQVRSF